MNNELIKFITSRTHFQARDIKPETRLTEDIGLYGLDSISFFEEFFDKFEIKNTEDLDQELHINGGPDFAPRPLNWLTNLMIREK